MECLRRIITGELKEMFWKYQFLNLNDGIKRQPAY